MFGYVKTDIPNMYVKDTVLYRSMYCGLCKSIGCTCGQKARLSLTYDLSFLSAFAHNVLNVDVEIIKKHCVLHWFRKRPIAKNDELTERIACLNVILSHYKLNDDIIDSNKGRFKRRFFIKAYKKALKREPEFDKIVKKNFTNLIEYEKTGGDSIDMSADYFGNMMKDIAKELFKSVSTPEIENVCYLLGKWIYLIDALDDFDKDKVKGEFNVFCNLYKDVKTKEELIRENRSEIEEVFGFILSDIKENALKIKYNFNHDLIDNILYFGLKKQTINIMEKGKCKKTTKS